MKRRETKQTIVLGFNGTGKSTLIKSIVKAYLGKPGRKALIITPDYAEWTDVEETFLEKPSDFDFTGARKYVFEDISILSSINKYLFDCLLVFDDCRSYMEASTDKRLKRLYIRRRHRMIDVVLVGHGFTDVPPKAFTNATDIWLFQTKDNIEERKRALRNFQEMVKAQERVNEKAKTNKHYKELIKFEP